LEAVQNFQKFIVTEARKNGLSPERLGEAVHLALSTAKPKARYAVIPQCFKNWSLRRLLPARMLDAELAKQMKHKAVISLQRVGSLLMTSRTNGKNSVSSQRIAAEKPNYRDECGPVGKISAL
jgi:hypothetical protein